MASEMQLRSRIRSLEQELERIRSNQQRLQTESLNRIDRETQALRDNYERALVRMQNETEAAYAARLREMQQSMSDQMNRTFQELQTEADRVAREQEEKLRELEQCNDELRALLKRAQDLTERTEELHCQLAKEAEQEMAKSRESADATPHEFFCAGDFDVINAHAEAISQEIAAKMYQAAASDAACVQLDFELLRSRVTQSLQDWLMAYQEYARIIKLLNAQIEALEKKLVMTIEGVYNLNVTEMNFWSSGTYLPFRNEVKQALETVNQIESLGVEAYLKEAKEGRRAIYSSLRQAHAWIDTLAGIQNCILSERVLSDERFSFGRRIAQKLRGMDYQIVRIGFRKPDPAMEQAPWYPGEKAHYTDPMNSFELQMQMRGAGVLHVVIVPVRKEGVAVRNDCLVWMEQTTYCDPEVEARLVNVNVERIREEDPTREIVKVIGGRDRASCANKAEKERKIQPDPQRQIRKVGRRYQGGHS